MFSSVLALAVDIPNRVTENDHLVKNRDVLSFLASHITETKALLADDRRVVGDVVRWETIWKFCTNPLGPMAEKLNLAPCLFAHLGASCLLGSTSWSAQTWRTLNLLNWAICIARLSLPICVSCSWLRYVAGQVLCGAKR
jgi:hypothetical protein